MITTVRISPMNRWCRGAIAQMERPDAYPKVALAKIITESMEQNLKGFCQGKVWACDMDWVNEARESLGMPVATQQRYMCEHMLEMD